MRLLISLGSTWPIVPEAYLHPAHPFTEVHVLTTAAEKIDPGLTSLQEWFTRHAPEVVLTITRVRDFVDLTCAADHEAFEEVLYRWFIAHRSEAGGLQVCLSGGFKSMSAAVQEAAGVFGCDGMFHVLSVDNPTDSDAIDAAHAAGRIHWIELGGRRGWTEFRRLEREAYPLELEGEWAAVPAELALRRRVHESLHRMQILAENWDRLEELPFRALATLPEPDLDWLRQRLNPEQDRAWVASLPKVELHSHLGGFATSGEELDDIRKAAADPERLPARKEIPLPPGWPLPAQPIGLRTYMALGDNNGSALLRDPGCLRRQVERLYRHLQREHVIYAEIRCSPGNYADPSRNRSSWDVLAQLVADFTRLRQEAEREGQPCAPSVNLLITATRRDAGDYRRDISRHISLAVAAAEHWVNPKNCRVVGVDLAGFEHATTRPHYFRGDFTAAHRAGLAVTIHAGENDDAEAIWSAVFDLNARRIGHGLQLMDSRSPALGDSIAARRIGVEMCPYANVQIIGYSLDPATEASTADLAKQYPLKSYLDRGIPVSINTDNIGISAASLTENLILAARLCPDLTRMDLLKMIRAAAETAFLPANGREALQHRLAQSLPRTP